MAAPAVVRSSGPPLCPSFAEVCSFLERYGPALDLPEMTFPQMERYLRDTTAVPKPLVELHVKLLRKLGRSVTTDRWEKYLAKVCQELNSTWAWELEQKGYQDMSMECKSSILKYLCECQFDENLKFKAVVNDEDPEKMRLQPIGRDRRGLMYWLQLDQEQNIRLYTEEQDDLDGSTWKCIVRTRNDLAEALDLLKTQIEPNQNQDQDQNPAGSRSTSPLEKDTGGEEASHREHTKPTRPQSLGDSDEAKLSRTSEEQPDGKRDDSGKEKKPIKQEVRWEQKQHVQQENATSEVKEERTDHAASAFDNRVSTITTIKPEPKDVDPPKNAVPVVMAPSTNLTKINTGEEVERAVVRSSQQAKIPLKKRDLKLADSFHSNHLNNSNSRSIIVCNPSVIQSNDGKLGNSVTPPSGPAASQQQLVVTASRQELTNGRASLFQPHKEGQNGVAGVVGHVGVIRSPSEHHRPSGALNGPSRTTKVDKEVSRQSVLVRKGLTEQETAPAATTLPPHAAAEAQTPRKQLLLSLKPDDITERKDPVCASSLSESTEEPKRQTVEDHHEETAEEECDKRNNTGNISCQQKDDLEETRGGEPGRHEEEALNEKRTSILGKADAVSSSAVSPPKVDKRDEKDHQGEGVNGGLSGQGRARGSGFGSDDKKVPLEEASSELQKEGIRLKIKIPPHRRNKLRGKGVREGEKGREPKGQDEGRPLRRSARICRSSALPTCRPSSKMAESQRKKLQRKPTTPARGRDEEEEDEEEQSSNAKRDRKAEPTGNMRKPRGRRRHKRPRWSNIRTKRRKVNEEGEDEEDRDQKEKDEGGSGSEEESCKSEELPSEDACTHCGLPNHPELILLCDSCDNGYHTACLRPPLMLIPDGEWFCPPCQHKLLCEKLEEQLQNLDSALKKKERAERRRERLVYVGISVENIIPEGDEEEEEKSAKKKDSKKSKNLGRRSTRTRKHISYRFDDFDDAIDEAIEEDVGDLCGGEDRGEDISAASPDDRKQIQRPIKMQSRTARNRKRRRLNDLESDSTAAESEDEFMLSNSSEDEDFGASGADDDEDDDDADAGSEVGSWDRGARPKKVLRGVVKRKPRMPQRRGRKRQRRCSTEEEGEDSDEEMDSDQFSDMTDSDADKKRRGLRRGMNQQVNYRETSESSDNSRSSTNREKVKAPSRPRREHLSSDYSDVPSSRESEEDDYEDEEDEDHRRRVNRRRRRDVEELRRSRARDKRRRHDDEDYGGGPEKRLRRGRPEKGDDRDKRRTLMRPRRDEEGLEKMGRGKRREILSEQRRKRLAQMLKKRRPSDEDDEDSDSDESEDEDSSSEEDRPVRKRLNRIDSDDDEEEEDDLKQKVKTKKSSAAERTAGDKHDSDAQEKGRGHSPSPSYGHQTSRGPAKPGARSPAAPRDSAGSGRHNGPSHPDEEEDEGQTDSVNSVQNSPRS